MVNFNAWRSSHKTSINPADRAVSMEVIAHRDLVSIVIERGDPAEELEAQTVRIEFDDTPPQQPTVPVTNLRVSRCIVYGVVDHPTEPNTDIQESDRFWRNGKQYEVKQIIRVPGQVQAQCEALR